MTSSPSSSPTPTGRSRSRIAERLRAGFRRPFLLGSRPLVIAPSVGIALVPDDGREPVELLQHADLAMYEAKATRSGHALFSRDLHPASRMRLETTERLRRAIQGGEVVVHYQPQVSLRTGAVTGVEALARWRHPDAGLVPPSGFLHQVESGGLMPLLTAVVLQQAIRQGAAWHAEGRQLTVAVNLSVTNLLDPHFPDQVVGPARRLRAAARHAGAGAHRGPVHGRPGAGPHGDRPAPRGRGVARRRRLRHGLLLARLPARPARHPWAEARPLLRHQHGRRPARRGDRGVDDQPRALPGHARGRRGRGDRRRAGPARRTRAASSRRDSSSRRRCPPTSSTCGVTYAARSRPA